MNTSDTWSVPGVSIVERGAKCLFPAHPGFFPLFTYAFPLSESLKQGGASDIIYLGIIQTPDAFLELQRRLSKKVRQFGGWSNQVQKMNRDHRTVLLPIIFIMGLFTSMSHRHDRVDTCGIFVSYLNICSPMHYFHLRI